MPMYIEKIIIIYYSEWRYAVFCGIPLLSLVTLYQIVPRQCLSDMLAEFCHVPSPLLSRIKLNYASSFSHSCVLLPLCPPSFPPSLSLSFSYVICSVFIILVEAHCRGHYSKLWTKSEGLPTCRATP